MADYLPVRKSQIYHYVQTPLYIKNDKEEFVFYKSENLEIDVERFRDDSYPQLYIREGDRQTAFAELQQQLRIALEKKIETGDLRAIKSAMCDLVKECFQGKVEENLKEIPATIDILFQGKFNTSDVLNTIGEIAFGETTLIEHSVNVMVLTLNYCLFTGTPEEEAKRLSLAALLHDVGLTKIDKKIAESRYPLSDPDFEVYKTHPSLGHDIVKQGLDVDKSVAFAILEHHERLNGQGYPRGIANMTFEGRLLGLLDCFDNLTNTQRTHRFKQPPFGAMQIIQREILEQGMFDKKIFRDICLSLTGKSM